VSAVDGAVESLTMRDEQLMRAAESHLRASGVRMAALVDGVGPCQITYTPPTFESLARSIVYQQISIRAARSIYAKLQGACKQPAALQPKHLLKLSEPQLRACGLSSQKVRYLLDLAAKTEQGLVEFHRFPAMSDEEVIAELTLVKGIGVWTAQMFLLFSLRRTDVWPTGDLGIRNAIKKLHRLKEAPTPAETELRGRKWRPYGSVASWYLWRSLEPTGPF
jgi:DNA-3-methyladenine glycosylase II